jgi:hypothetical protein
VGGTDGDHLEIELRDPELARGCGKSLHSHKHGGHQSYPEGPSRSSLSIKVITINQGHHYQPRSSLAIKVITINQGHHYQPRSSLAIKVITINQGHH